MISARKNNNLSSSSQRLKWPCKCSILFGLFFAFKKRWQQKAEILNFGFLKIKMQLQNLISPHWISQSTAIYKKINDRMSGTLLASEVNLPLTSLDTNDLRHNGVRNALKLHSYFQASFTKSNCSIYPHLYKVQTTFSKFQTRHFKLKQDWKY